MANRTEIVNFRAGDDTPFAATLWYERVVAGSDSPDWKLSLQVKDIDGTVSVMRTCTLPLKDDHRILIWLSEAFPAAFEEAIRLLVRHRLEVFDEIEIQRYEVDPRMIDTPIVLSIEMEWKLKLTTWLESVVTARMTDR